MASTFTLKSHSYDGRYVYLECSQSKDIATNKSTISWKISTIGGGVNYYSSSVRLTINGWEVYNSGRVNWERKIFPAAKGSTSGTTYVDHDDYGNKTINVVMTVMIYDGVERTTSDNWTLDNIPRAATITKWPESFESNDEPPTVEYSNPLGNNVTALEMCIADKTAYYGYVKYRELNKTGTSYKFTASDMEALKAIAGNSLDLTFVIYTKIGDSEFWSHKPSTLIMVEDETTKPSVTLEVTLDNSSLPSEFSEVWVQGKSRAVVSVDAEGKYNASITSISTQIGNDVYNGASFKSNVVDVVGKAEITATATDSRGFKGTDTKEVDVIEYSKPLVVPISSENAIQCYRSDGNGKRIGNSTSLWIKAKRSYHKVNNLNQCALQWRKKLVTDAWGNQEWTDLISKTTTNTEEYNALLQGVEFDLRKSYTIQIRAIDDIGEYDSKDFEIPTQDVALHLGKGGKNVSVGTYCDYSEEYTFYSDWKAIFDKDVFIKGNALNDFVVEQGTSGIWAYRKWESGIAECWGLYSITNAEVTTAWGSVFETATEYRVDFPKGLFVERPVANYSASTATGGVLALETMYETTKDMTCGLYPIRALPETIDLIVAIQAKGIWKENKEEE